MTNEHDVQVDAIGKQTRLTVGLFIALLGGVAATSMTFGHWKAEDAAWKRSINEKLQELHVQGTDRWTGADMERLLDRIGELNPTLVLPKPFKNHR